MSNKHNGKSTQAAKGASQSPTRPHGAASTVAGPTVSQTPDWQAAAKSAQERLVEQKREQEADIRRLRTEADADIAKAKQQLVLEVSTKRSELSALEQAVKEQQRAYGSLERALSERESSCRKKEAALAEQAARLSEREINAEQGFLTEKVQILLPIQEQVARFREQRDKLEAEIAARQSAAQLTAREQAAQRAQTWAQQDAQRTASEADERRKFDEAFAVSRQQRQTQLEQEVAAERRKAEDGWRQTLKERTDLLDGRAAELRELTQNLDSQARELRRAQRDLNADQDMLAEDKSALERKVQRLVTEGTEDLRHQLDSLTQQLSDARTTRDTYGADLDSRRELDRRFGGRTPKQVLGDLTALERDRDGLAQQLRERLDPGAELRLAMLEKERSAWLEQQAVLQGDLAKATGELANRRLAAIELETLRTQKEALEASKQLLDGAVAELRGRVDELTRQDDHRNPMPALTDMDADENLQTQSRTTSPLRRATPTLAEFAQDLRHRIAVGVEGRTLYYAERDVRAFLGGLAMTRLMLLQGISGTGKTSLPLAFTTAVGGAVEVVEVQAGWRDRQDLIGYYNAFHRHYYPTNFLQALYRAGTPAHKDRLFLIVLDEINLSRPEQFFADFLSALEQPIDMRRLTLVQDAIPEGPKLLVDGKHLPIPPNVWFVGTANHDESTTGFAEKTYDRAHIMEMPRKTEASEFEVQSRGPRGAISHVELEKAFDEAVMSHGTDAKKATAWLRTAQFAKTLQSQFRVSWGNRLENQLGRYLPVVVEAGGSVGEAMDHLLETKVLRKLRDRHDVRHTALEQLREQLWEAWPELDEKNLPDRCLALIEDELGKKRQEDV
ncbi:MAG: hypothetical protein EXR77_17825 [Myxococcales bacterium]|nr:hypothetical protein [Myxococcales bacterium]